MGARSVASLENGKLRMSEWGKGSGVKGVMSEWEMKDRKREGKMKEKKGGMTHREKGKNEN